MSKSFRVKKEFNVLQNNIKKIAQYTDLILDEISCANIRDILNHNLIPFHKDDEWKFLLTTSQGEHLFKNDYMSIAILDVIYDRLIKENYIEQIEVTKYESDDSVN